MTRYIILTYYIPTYLIVFILSVHIMVYQYSFIKFMVTVRNLNLIIIIFLFIEKWIIININLHRAAHFIEFDHEWVCLQRNVPLRIYFHDSRTHHNNVYNIHILPIYIHKICDSFIKLKIRRMLLFCCLSSYIL